MKIKFCEFFLYLILYWCLGFWFATYLITEQYIDTTNIIHNIKPIIYDEKAIFTAYTLYEDECDSSPKIGAANINLENELRKGNRICATRLFPLFSEIDIKGIGRCYVLDRTSRIYGERIDILFKTKKEAFEFGKKELRFRLIK